jgi:integrase
MASSSASRWAILSGLRRGELFMLRWEDIDEQSRLLTVREAVYDRIFATPKPKRARVKFRSRIRR